MIPVDTIRRVKESGLISGAIYRPSRATKIKYIASLLSRDEGKIARAMAQGEREPDLLLQSEIEPKSKILMSDLAGEYLQYEYSKKKVNVREFQERFWKILRVRSSLGGPEEDYRVPPPDRPDEGHHSNRFRLGFGVREDRFFEEVAFRPAYHDLLDDDRGYVEGAQIIFADTALRFYSSERKLVLQRFDLIDIISLSPRDLFFKPLSWKIKTGLLQRAGEDGNDHLVYELNPGGGVSYKVDERSTFYFLAETNFIAGKGLDGTYAAGIGASAGFITDLMKAWKIHLFAREIYYGLGDEDNAWEAGLHQNLILSRNMSLRLEFDFSRIHGYDRTEAGVFWNVYF